MSFLRKLFGQKQETTTSTNSKPSSSTKVPAKTADPKLTGEDKEIALALKAWYRQRAEQWWQNSSKQSAVCDDGNESLQRGDGYFRPGNYLCCENCTNSFLESTNWDKAIHDLEKYFGPGLPESVKSKRRPANVESSNVKLQSFDFIEKALNLSPSTEMKLVYIPAGEFLMGSDVRKDEYAEDNELPLHTIHLDEFWIGKYPVTNAQYLEFITSTSANYPLPKHWKDGGIPEGMEFHPVVYVSWYDALAFCKWMNEITGKQVRLPTEAEWEKAARGVDGRMFPWGNKQEFNRCNFNSHSTTPVGKYSPDGDSPFGCTDMAGNVRDWCTTLNFTKYPYQADDGRENLEAKKSRIARGASFYPQNIEYMRCANRSGYRADEGYQDGGFRVVITSL